MHNALDSCYPYRIAQLQQDRSNTSRRIFAWKKIYMFREEDSNLGMLLKNLLAWAGRISHHWVITWDAVGDLPPAWLFQPRKFSNYNCLDY